MSWIGRLRNVFRRDELTREIDEEMALHMEEAIERGRSPEDVRRAFGGVLQNRERSRDVKLLAGFESILSDVRFGWRQLRRNRTATVAAVLSLALAIGATSAAF